MEKIYEKEMHSRLMGFLGNQNLYARQFGFCKGHSTVHALINIVERVRKYLDNGEFAWGVFVDLQKPFKHNKHNKQFILKKYKHLMFMRKKLVTLACHFNFNVLTL